MRRCKSAPIKDPKSWLPCFLPVYNKYTFTICVFLPISNTSTECQTRPNSNPRDEGNLSGILNLWWLVCYTELRPKGRGRPQRILTGSWPEDHVHGVIRAVVFRDPSSLPRHIDREDASKLTANRSAASASMSRLLTVHPPHQQSVQVRPDFSLTNKECPTIEETQNSRSTGRTRRERLGNARIDPERHEQW